MSEKKICNKCNIELPIDNIRKIHKNGVTSYYLGKCKECEYKYSRKYIENKKKAKFSDGLKILIQRQYKEIKEERV